MNKVVYKKLKISLKTLKAISDMDKYGFGVLDVIGAEYVLRNMDKDIVKIEFVGGDICHAEGKGNPKKWCWINYDIGAKNE